MSATQTQREPLQVPSPIDYLKRISLIPYSAGRGIGILDRAINISGRSVVGDEIPDSEDLHARYDVTVLGDIYSDGGSITSWPDETANGNSTTGGDPEYQATELNGNPTAYDDGTDVLDGALHASLSESDGICFFAYIGPNLQSGFGGIIGHGGGEAYDEWLLRRDDNGNYQAIVDLGGSGAELSVDDSQVEDGNSHSLIASVKNSKLRVYLNGAEVDSLDVTGYAITSDSLSMFQYEGGDGSIYPWAGKLSEVGVYSIGKDASTVSDLHKYLDAKWY